MQHGFSASHIGVTHIDFNSAEQRLQLPAPKVLSAQALLHAAKNRALIQHGQRIGTFVFQPFGQIAGLQGAPHGHYANGDQDHRPERAPGKVGDAQRVQQEEDTQRHQHRAPRTAAWVKELDEAGKDQDQGPEHPDAAGIYNSKIVQQEDGANGQDDRSGDEALIAAGLVRIHLVEDPRLDLLFQIASEFFWVVFHHSVGPPSANALNSLGAESFNLIYAKTRPRQSSPLPASIIAALWSDSAARRGDGTPKNPPFARWPFPAHPSIPRIPPWRC